MNRQEFADRRAALMKAIGPGGMALVAAAPEAIRNRDAEYPYRQDSDFYYLTGFPEPEALAVIIPGREQGQFILFCRENDPEKEIWHGRRAGLEGACEQYGADDAFPITDIDDIIPGLMESCDKLYYAMGCNQELDSEVMDWMNQLRGRARQGVHVPTEIGALDHLLHEMRLFKSAAEADVMREAADIAAEAHIRAMQVCRPGMMEYELEAEFLYTFRRRHAVPSYNSIVGGGENGCILHYINNDAELKDGDLVLIDAGAEYDYYASDITRTFPVNGRFSEPQKALYELVLKAQYAAIEVISPGRPWNISHDAAVRVITEGLRDLGLLAGKLEVLIEEEAYKRFFMHRTGHWLGMDVHDVGDYKIDEVWRTMEPGMVMTVEPGIYVSPAEDIAEQWWNIGIRIEDDVLVTADGYEILTSRVPKSVADIEALMASAQAA